MITQREIREKAREHGVPESTIERDYAQNWLLMALSSLDMVLKGETGIRKVYFGDYRFSDDLDFTLLKVVAKEKLEASIKESIKMAKEESGISFSDDINFKENDNGFEIYAYFRILRKSGSPLKIKLDITQFGNEEILLPLSKRIIIYPYSDNLEAEAKVYSLEEMVAEKVRSLFQRIRPRDLYDVWHLWNNVDKKKVLNIFPEKFKFKNAKINIKDFENEKDDFKNAWEKSLKHQIKELPDFEEVVSTVFKEVKKMRIEKEKYG